MTTKNSTVKTTKTAATSATIRERLNRTRQAVCLMQAAAQALADPDMADRGGVDREDMVSAALASAQEAAGHLYWLSLLPASEFSA